MEIKPPICHHETARMPTPEELQARKEAMIVFLKKKRKAWNDELEELKTFQKGLIYSEPGRELALMITKHQEMKHWAGEALAQLGVTNPYPNSKDPSNTIIDPPADK
jgi:hypothetical protein